MYSKSDVMLAKSEWSERLLTRASAFGPMALEVSLSIANAVESASHNVHSVGVGHKPGPDGQPGELAIRFYVVEKLPLSMLAPAVRLPSIVDGIPTDVVEAPPPQLMAKKAATCTSRRKDRQRPVMGGISAAHFAVTVGTIGYFCRSTKEGDDPTDDLVLSCNHVFANLNVAAIGDPLYQHAPFDGGTAADVFATLFRFHPVAAGGTVANRVDAAVGKLTTSKSVKICKIGKVKGIMQGIEGRKVRKHGRTTGYTEGIIDDESVDSLVRLDAATVGKFEGQLRLIPAGTHRAFAGKGDSGSLIVDLEENKAVGLYFAGPGDGSYGLANPIEEVLSTLEIELL